MMIKLTTVEAREVTCEQVYDMSCIDPLFDILNLYGSHTMPPTEEDNRRYYFEVLDD